MGLIEESCLVPPERITCPLQEFVEPAAAFTNLTGPCKSARKSPPNSEGTQLDSCMRASNDISLQGGSIKSFRVQIWVDNAFTEPSHECLNASPPPASASPEVKIYRPKAVRAGSSPLFASLADLGARSDRLECPK